MRERIIKSDKFIKEVSQTFFTMLTDQEFLAITTEVYIILIFLGISLIRYKNSKKIYIILCRRLLSQMREKLIMIRRIRKVDKKTHNPNNFNKTFHIISEGTEKVKIQRCLAKPPW